MRVQLLLDQIGDGRLARARQAGEPQHRRLLVLQRGVRVAGDVERLPVDVLRRGAARSAACPAATVALVSLSIRMKPPSVAAVGIGLEHDRLVGRQIGDADGVELERLGRQMLHAC